MTILALDTSSKAGSCALFVDDSLVGEFFINSGLTHSQTILPLVEQLLEITNTPTNEIDVLAVSHGPGSFTGLRIGLSSVKGMALALDIPVVGVSTLLGLAYNLTHCAGFILPVMDARRNTVYTGLFHSDGSVLTQLVADANIAITEIVPLLNEHCGQNDPVYLVGDGALLCKDILEPLCKQTLVLAPATLLHQRASSVALAAQAQIALSGTIDQQDLVPIYLRMTQAERERSEGIDHSAPKNKNR